MGTANTTEWMIPLNTSNRSDNSVNAYCPSPGMSATTAQTIQIVLYSLIIIGSLCGNCLVIAIVVKTTKLKTTTNYLIANMAVSDLLVPIFAVPVKIVETYSGNSWLVSGALGEILCKLIPFCVEISTAVSIQCLVAIALDRYYALMYPLKPHLLSRRRCLISIALIWVLAGLFYSPYFFTFRPVSVGDKFYCLASWEPAFSHNHKTVERVHYLIIFVLLYLVPLLTTCALYTVIARDLMKKHSNRSIASKRRTKENRSVACMMATVVMVFIVCYTPSHVWYMLYYNESTILGCNAELVFKISLFLFYINGALNPIIYFIFSTKYSNAVKNLFSKLMIS